LNSTIDPTQNHLPKGEQNLGEPEHPKTPGLEHPSKPTKERIVLPNNRQKFTNPYTQGKVFLINKPLKWTSFDAVNKLKGLIQIKLKLTQDPSGRKLKVGHAGTLDPLATGLLLICTGTFTKRIEEFQAQEKEYTGIFCLGATTASFDLETPIDQHYPIEHITTELLHQTAQKFIGTIDQTPPVFSAIKVGGKRAYKLARRGLTPELKSSPKTITIFELTKIELPYVHFRVACSKGTYIRSLARDFGQALNSGAHLTQLCRTRIGDFKLQDAQTLEQLKEELLPL